MARASQTVVEENGKLSCATSDVTGNSLYLKLWRKVGRGIGSEAQKLNELIDRGTGNFGRGDTHRVRAVRSNADGKINLLP